MDFSSIITFIKEVILSLLTLLTMFSPLAQSVGETYTAERPDDLVASFAVVSDVHVESNFPESYRNYREVLRGIKAGENIDAAVFTGDNVMNGQLFEDFLFYTALRVMHPAEENIVVVGNHDLGNSYGDYEQLRKKFIANNNLYLGNDITESYYYKVVGGCYMIVLASEDTTTWDFRMSEEQFAWLEGVLKQAQEEDARVFVFNHYPLRYLKDSDPSRLANLLKAYDCELFIHGHIHDDLDRGNFYNSYGVDCINLPRITEVHQYEAGDGIVVEVYEDEIVVRGRDFIKGEWIEELRYTY